MSTGTLRLRRRVPAGSGLRFGARTQALAPDAVAAIVLTLLAAALRFYGISHQGFWFDEGNTALLVHLSPGQMLGLIPQSESTPPLYYCVAWVWARAFGFGEAPLRSLSAVCGVLTVPLMFAAGRRLAGARVGVVAAALTACSPLLIWYAQEARSYAMLVAFSALTVWAWAGLLEQPTRRRLATWVIACALALATHYYALLAVAPEAAWLLVRHRRRRDVLLAVGTVTLCGLALAPLAIGQNATGNANWIAPIQLRARLDQLAPMFLEGFQIPHQSLLEPLAFALAALALGLAALAGDPRERGMAVGAAALAVGGLAFNLLLIAVGIDDLITRNVLALFPAAALALAAGLGARRAGVVGLLAAAGLCAIGAYGAIAVQTHLNYQRPDWRGVARLLGPRPAPGQAQRAILVQHYRDLLPLSLYLPRVSLMRRAGVAVTELDVVSFTAPRAHLCWWGAACNLVGSELQAAYDVPGFHPVWRRRFAQFTVLRLAADSPTLLTPHRVARALHSTRLTRDELLVQR